MACRFSTSSSIVSAMLALSSSPSACMPPVPSRTRSDARPRRAASSIARVVGDLERRLPGRHVDEQVVARLGRGARRPGPHGERSMLGPKPICASLDRHCRPYSERATRPGSLRARTMCMAVELDHPFSTARLAGRQLRPDPRPRPRDPVRRGRQRARAHRARLGEGRDQDQDGRDVDDVHRHRRGHRAGRRTRTGPSCASSRARPAGRDTPTRPSRSSSRRAAGRCTRTRRSPARPRRWARVS